MPKSRSGRSKKRRFNGNRYTIRAIINENDETFSKLTIHNQERKMLKVTECVVQGNINDALSEIKGSNNFTKCGISIDGTWQRRCYSSFNGCVRAISVDTVKSLDIEVMTQYCHICA
ncbi:hypothetical protein TNCV_1845141 [Trichonephila clavipes]|nr:hypothetical protein TNCV_1845141 [Trichonephila clavipes]